MHSASFLLGAALISRYNTANHRCPQSDAEGEGGDSAKPPGVGIGVGTWKAGGHRPLPWGTLASLWAAIPVLCLLSHLCHDAPPQVWCSPRATSTKPPTGPDDVFRPSHTDQEDGSRWVRPLLQRMGTGPFDSARMRSWLREGSAGGTGVTGSVLPLLKNVSR